MKIKVFYDELNYRIPEIKEIKRLIEKVIRNENKIPGDLNFIITGDNELKEINIEFLKQDHFTDVIAFDYCKKNVINGEVYISIDTVKINAHNYKISLKEELLRVLIHGTLHLCGYKDKKRDEKELMKNMEDKWINEFGKS